MHIQLSSEVQSPESLVLRSQDAEELRLTNRSVTSSLAASRWCGTLFVDGKPAGIGGLCPGPEPYVGQPWLVGTEDLTRYPKEFHRQLLALRKYALQQFPVLTNVVHLRNEEHIRWLQALGAKFHQSKEFPGFLCFFITR